MNSSDVIAWLESPAGESWSRAKHNTDGFRTFLVKVLPDDLMSDNDALTDFLWYA